MHENNTPVLQDQGDIIGSCLEPLLHLAVTEAGLLIKTLDQELHLIGAEACHWRRSVLFSAGTAPQNFASMSTLRPTDHGPGRANASAN